MYIPPVLKSIAIKKKEQLRVVSEPAQHERRNATMAASFEFFKRIPWCACLVDGESVTDRSDPIRRDAMRSAHMPISAGLMAPKELGGGI